MAGFRNKDQKLIGDRVTSLSTFGLRISDMLIANTETSGIKKPYVWGTSKFGEQRLNQYGLEEVYDFVGGRSGQKANVQKHPNYELIRQNLRKYATIDIIEDVLETISDETISYDDNRMFCNPKPIDIELKEDIKEAYRSNFFKIYSLFGFDDGISAWNLFKKWLVDGFIAFEIIYDDAEIEIIGFREIDPKDLEYIGYSEDEKVIYWNYTDPYTRKVIRLPDSKIIYISYTGLDSEDRISYLQRLIRPYNIMDALEQSKIIYSVTNAVFNKVITIPVTGKSKAQAKQSLATLMGHYKEDVSFDTDTGILEIDGKRSLPFYKEYWFPEKQGERPQIDTLRNEGPDLTRMDLDHFIKRFYISSKVPMNRFDMESSPRFHMGDPNDIERKEVRYAMFISRLRSIFQEIITKPLWLQMCLTYPALQSDSRFYSEVAINYHKNNYFEELKEQEITSRRIDHIDKLKRLQDDSGERDSTYFSTDWLVRKILIEGNLEFTEEALEENQKLLEKHRPKKDDGDTGSRW